MMGFEVKPSPPRARITGDAFTVLIHMHERQCVELTHQEMK